MRTYRCYQCGAILNDQGGFSDWYSTWGCTVCGYINPMNKIHEDEEWDVPQKDNAPTVGSFDSIADTMTPPNYSSLTYGIDDIIKKYEEKPAEEANPTGNYNSGSYGSGSDYSTSRTDNGASQSSASPVISYCANCGSKVPRGADFCPMCGTRVDSMAGGFATARTNATQADKARDLQEELRYQAEQATRNRQAFENNPYERTRRSPGMGDSGSYTYNNNYNYNQGSPVRPDSGTYYAPQGQYGQGQPQYGQPQGAYGQGQPGYDPRYPNGQYADPRYMDTRFFDPRYMTPEQYDMYMHPGKKRKSKATALILCFFFGVFGAHKFYEERYLAGVLYLCTFGFLGIGWLIDMFALAIKPDPYYV